MVQNTSNDANVIANMSINDIHYIEKNLNYILYIKDKLELTKSLREKDLLIESIVSCILNIQDTIKK